MHYATITFNVPVFEEGSIREVQQVNLSDAEVVLHPAETVEDFTTTVSTCVRRE